MNNVRKEVKDFMNGAYANNDGWEDIKITSYKIIKEVAKSLDITLSDNLSEANENDKSMPLRSTEVKDKENSKKGIIWQVFYGEKDNLHKEFKNEEEAKKFATENNGKLMPLRSTEESLKEYW